MFSTVTQSPAVRLLSRTDLLRIRAVEHRRRAFAISGALLLSCLITSACARVEATDRFGNSEITWLLASAYDFGNEDSTKIYIVRGVGMHNLGDSWSLGIQDSQVILIPSDCQFVMLDADERYKHRTEQEMARRKICSDAK